MPLEKKRGPRKNTTKSNKLLIGATQSPSTFSAHQLPNPKQRPHAATASAPLRCGYAAVAGPSAIGLHYQKAEKTLGYQNNTPHQKPPPTTLKKHPTKIPLFSFPFRFFFFFFLSPNTNHIRLHSFCYIFPNLTILIFLSHIHPHPSHTFISYYSPRGTAPVRRARR